MRTCTKCHIEKHDEQFRFKIEKRRGKVSSYRRYVCLDCEAEMRRIATRKKRATPEGREKHNNLAREFYHRHREKCCADNRERRNKEEKKQARREYIERNKEKIKSQEVVTKRRYQVKHMANLTDEYISMKLFNCIDREFIKKYPELIEAKRLQILIKRKTNNNGKNQTHG